ncbi:MAG TPA: squalene/phytoene synthase family protein [Candidatus Acidoferrales bacterium]|nr:squalene/phytoene synthase family protein [Candidatus Acidoferrales bacterium]
MPKETRVAKASTLEAADAYCRFLCRHHYENFEVASLFVGGDLRLDLARLYAYCRTTDDLGDESADGTALARLARWRGDVGRLFEGETPDHPVLLALGRTIRRHDMPAAPFLDLIEANVRDQHVKAYRSWDELIGYCRLSAAPVGRMVLRVFGIDDPRAGELSDDVCIGLQLANHAQDVSRDAAIGRRYLVETDLDAGRTAGAVRAMVGRARTLLASGLALEAMVPLALRLQLAVYRQGGQAICDAIERLGYQTEKTRPHVPLSTKLSIVVRTGVEAVTPQKRVAAR